MLVYTLNPFALLDTPTSHPLCPLPSRGTVYQTHDLISRSHEGTPGLDPDSCTLSLVTGQVPGLE